MKAKIIKTTKILTKLKEFPKTFYLGVICKNAIRCRLSAPDGAAGDGGHDFTLDSEEQTFISANKEKFGRRML